MKDLTRWLHNHPVKALLFLFASVCIGAASSVRDDLPLRLGLPLTAVLLIVWVVNWRIDKRKLISILLAVTLAHTAIAADPSPDAAVQESLHADAAGCIVGGAVVVGGVFAMYLIIKLCKRVFPDPNPPPDIGTNGLPGFSAETDAACYLDQPLYSGCYVDCDANGGPLTASSSSPTWTVVAIDVEIAGGTARLKSCRSSAAPRMLDLEEFKAALSARGLMFDETRPGVSHAQNGISVPSEQSPVQFGKGSRGTVPIIVRDFVSRVIPVTLERSEDLRLWEPLAEAHVAEGMTLRIVDTSLTGQRFYRIRTN